MSGQNVSLASLAAVLSEFEPHAAELDQQRSALRRAFLTLGERGLLAIRCPARWGGPELTREDLFLAKVVLAKTSGALAFLCTQMHSAVGMIAASKNLPLADEVLSEIHRGQPRIGIGYGYLRRSDNIPLRAKPTKDGYILNGLIPWATGHGIFEQLLVGAALPDGNHLLAIIPFQERDGIRISSPLSLASMEVTQTCELRCHDLLVRECSVVDIREPSWIERSDEERIIDGAGFALGCSAAALRSLQESAARSGESATRDVAASLRTEFDELHARCIFLLSSESEGREERLRLRGRVHEFSARAAFSAVVAAGGASNLLGHAAQRVYREALAWAVLAQSKATQKVTLECVSEM